MIGPIGLLFIGITAAVEVGRRLREETEAHNRDLEALGSRLSRSTETRGQEDQLLRSLRKQAERGPTTAETLRDSLPLGPYLGGLLPDSGARERQQQRETHERTRQQLLQRRRERARAADAGEFLGADALAEEVDRSARRTAQELQRGNITRAEAIERIDNAILSAEESLSGARRRKKVAELAGLSIDLGGARNLFEQAAKIGAEGLQERADTYESLSQLGELGARDIERLTVESHTAAQRLAGKKDVKSRLRFAEINKQRIEAIEANADEQLQEDLLLARGQDERRAAYGRYGRRVTGGSRRGGQRAIQDLRSLIAEDEQKLEVQLREEYQGSDIRRGGTARGSRATQAIRERIRGRRRQIRRIARQMDLDEEEIEQIMREQEIAQYQEESAFRSAQTDLGQYSLQRGLPRIRYQIQRVRLEVTEAIRVYGRNSAEVLQLLAQEQSLLEQQSDEQLGLLQAQGELRVAGLEGSALTRGQLGNLNEQIGFLQQNKGSQTEILQLQAQRKGLYADLRRQEQEEAEQRRQEMLDKRRAYIESIYELRISRTDDPERIARLELRRDRRLNSQLGPLSDPNERRQLQAQRNRSRRGLRDAVVDAELETIRHRAALEKLTTDQEIKALQRLLNTHKMSRDARRRIREQIHQLKNETEDEGQFDLNVGNIRLPTIYEIRRAVASGRSGQSVTVQNRNNVAVTITDPAAVPAFAAQMEQVLGTSQAALARAGGAG
jgi:hypothetical protein